MIKLTGIDNKEFILNADIIERIDEMPQSVITLTNGRKYIVTETADEICKKVLEFRRKILNSDYLNKST
jgi:flagellar protein FlbD